MPQKLLFIATTILLTKTHKFSLTHTTPKPSWCVFTTIFRIMEKVRNISKQISVLQTLCFLSLLA